MNTPCQGRTNLFEPYLQPGESSCDRSYRVAYAMELCKDCPLQEKRRCFSEGLKNKYTRGVWGGQLRTALTTEKDFDEGRS